MQLLVISFILGLFSAFAVLFLSRFEVREGISIREWVIRYAPRLISEMFGCDFCLSWWICLASGLVLSLKFGLVALLAAVLATPIARHFE